MLEETDYVNEARNLQYFAEHLAPLSSCACPRFTASSVATRYSTMSRVRGLRLQEFLQTKPSQAVARPNRHWPHAFVFLSAFSGAGAARGPAPRQLPAQSRRHHQPRGFWVREISEAGGGPAVTPNSGLASGSTIAALFAEIIRVIFGPSVSPQAPRVRQAAWTRSGASTTYSIRCPTDPRARPGGPEVYGRFEGTRQTLLKNKFLSPEFLFLSRAESGMCQLAPHAAGPHAGPPKSPANGCLPS